jgi:hypothetical protein
MEKANLQLSKYPANLLALVTESFALESGPLLVPAHEGRGDHARRRPLELSLLCSVSQHVTLHQAENCGGAVIRCRDRKYVVGLVNVPTNDWESTPRLCKTAIRCETSLGDAVAG